MQSEHAVIQESWRYIDNAKAILKEKAGKQGDYYADAKYVKMAGHTAWTGVLVALDAITPKKPKGKRMDIDWYKDNMAKQNKTTFKDLVSAYNYLHLLAGYDGDLNVKTMKTGLELAENIISWVAKKLD
jgi:hypothetical protein